MSYTPQYVTKPDGINAELTKISVAISRCVQRYPNGANQLESSLDMNSNRLLNLPKATTPTDPVRFQDMEEYVLNASLGGVDLSSKQDTLVSGQNIKTINNQSILGPGNLVVTGAGGTTDHSALLNRGLPDQHSIEAITGLQTVLDSKANTVHTQDISTVTGLQAELDAKAAVSHTHTISNVTGLQAAIDSKAAVVHTHVIADITSLQTTLDTKAGTSVATTSLNGLMSAADKTKLGGIATGATANSPDATLLARANHTGSQAISTVTNLQTTLDGKQATLVSGTNIKTINGTSVLGSGNIVISGGGGGGLVDGDYGDVVVSGTGTVMTLDASITASINRAKLFGLIGMTR